MSGLRIDHVGLWVSDLERQRQFYVEVLGGKAGAQYVNERTGFRSYFVSFGDGARLELMSRRAGQLGTRSAGESLGYAHIALQLGSPEAVDSLFSRLEAAGVAIVGRPRTTGDGYYEAVVADPEGNLIELAGPAGSRTRG